MSHITNKSLILEAIRRTRYKEKRNDGTFHEGCRPAAVFHRLNGWMKPEEKRVAFEELLTANVIVAGFWRYKRRVGLGPQKSQESVYGQLSSFHPRAPEKSGLTKFITTPRGRFLPHRLGRVTIPEGMQYCYEFNWSQLFIVADGIPDDFPRETVKNWK